MTITLLNEQEARKLNSTHVVKITHADLTEAATNTAQVIEMLTVGEGTLVRCTGTRCITGFTDASDAAFNVTSIEVGDGGSVARFLVAQELNTNGTEVFTKAGVAGAYGYVAADTVDVKFTSMSAKALVDIDAGEVHIFLHVVDLDSHI